MIFLIIHLIFVHFAVEMITFIDVIFRYEQFNHLITLFDCFRIHKCYFAVTTFGKLSGHAETMLSCCMLNVALIVQQYLLSKFLGIETIVINLFLLIFKGRCGLFQSKIGFVYYGRRKKKMFIYSNPRFISLLCMH